MSTKEKFHCPLDNFLMERRRGGKVLKDNLVSVIPNRLDSKREEDIPRNRKRADLILGSAIGFKLGV